MSSCCGSSCGAEALASSQRKVLWVALVLNAGMFFAEFIAGWTAESTALMADALDMLADATVYALGLYAVGRALSHKLRAARINGSLQLGLGLLVLADVGRRALLGSEPEPLAMTLLSVLALGVNTLCFVMLTRFREGDINLRSTWICTRNDMIANVGVLVGAALVAWSGQAWPDLAVGVTVASLVTYSGWQILREASRSAKEAELSASPT